MRRLITRRDLVTDARKFTRWVLHKMGKIREIKEHTKELQDGIAELDEKFAEMWKDG